MEKIFKIRQIEEKFKWKEGICSLLQMKEENVKYQNKNKKKSEQFCVTNKQNSSSSKLSLIR